MASRKAAGRDGGTRSAVALVERGRRSYAGRAWQEAFDSLSRADARGALDAHDLELLAISAYMLGRDDEHVRLLERAASVYSAAGACARAARCAFWIGHALADRRQLGPAGGWFARATRLLEQEDGECAESGYLLLPVMLQQAAGGDAEGALATAIEVTGIAERFGDRDLLALSLMGQGRALIGAGRIREGFERLDEAMVAVTAGELSPIVTGLVYCGLIIGCRVAYEPRRAREWTSALTRWCDGQPDLVVYTGECLLHRAEVLQLHGEWPAALEEAERAGRRFATRIEASRNSAAEAAYRRGELHRLRGEAPAAEAAYREASELGLEPQPGMALLRLAQGKRAEAAAAVRRALREARTDGGRAALLPALVEIALAQGEIEEARSGALGLEQIASAYGSELLTAAAAHARGAVELAAGDSWAALVSLRHACRLWRELAAPYETARVRVLLGIACRALGDRDSAELELDAARRAFAELGAAPDLTALDEPGGVTAATAGGLTRRELQVLGLVARGDTNRAIAEHLVISEKTVARHLSNIFAKLGVSSRSAATAYAYEHHLL